MAIKENGLEKRGDSLNASADNLTALLRLAVDKEASVEAVEKLTSLYEKIVERQSVGDFITDFASFKAECPAIVKSQEVSIRKQSGGSYGYWFAPLDAICATIDPVLQRYGFSYRWDSETNQGNMRVTCHLDHRGGHTKAAHFECPTDSKNPGMSSQQKAASALTFAKRQSLTSVLGIATADKDNDGAVASEQTRISESQAADLKLMLEEVEAQHPGTAGRFFKWLRITDASEITIDRYDDAIRRLKQKLAE